MMAAPAEPASGVDAAIGVESTRAMMQAASGAPSSFLRDRPLVAQALALANEAAMKMSQGQ